MPTGHAHRRSAVDVPAGEPHPSCLGYPAAKRPDSSGALHVAGNPLTHLAPLRGAHRPIREALVTKADGAAHPAELPPPVPREAPPASVSFPSVRAGDAPSHVLHLPDDHRRWRNC